MSAIQDQLQELADDVVRTVGDVSADAEANVNVTRTRHGLTRFANSFVHQHVSEDTRVVHLTLAVDGRTATASTTDADPGAYPVVLMPEAAATLLTFLAFYGFNGKAHREGASFVALGEQQFDPTITITADPSDPRAIGLPFDAEGAPRRRYHLVEDGVTRNLAHDRRTARAVGADTTGDALPGGAGMGAFPVKVVLRPGAATADDMIASVEWGLLVTQFHYCRILDPKSQVVTGLTRNGTFLIEDGKVGGAVGNLRFTQSFLSALGTDRVSAIGGDARFASGEFGQGMIIAPSFQLASWNFIGGARG